MHLAELLITCSHSVVCTVMKANPYVLEKTVPNMATVLKEEISRLARREIRALTETLRKASTQYRRDIAELKRQVTELQRKAAFLEKQVPKDLPTPPADAESMRFNAKGLHSHRQRLGLSAAECAKLIGVSGQTIYNWENGQSRPRQEQLAHIVALRHMGKREARELLEQMGNIKKSQ